MSQAAVRYVAVALVTLTIASALGYDIVIVYIVCEVFHALALLSSNFVALTDSPGWLKAGKDLAAFVQSLATVVAIVIGAWWVLKRRRLFPRAKFNATVVDARVTDDRLLLHVSIAVENVGDVLLSLGPSIVCVQQLVPLSSAHRERVAAGGALLPTGALEVDWPVLDKCEPDWKGHEFEPGETGSFEFDFTVPSGIETVLVYSYFTNLAKQNRGEMGWNATTVHHISDKTKAKVSSERKE